MGIGYVDGRRFARAVVAGADWVLHTRDQLDRINVFPVPDGDTGTNLALSLSAAASAVRGLDERDLGRVARTVAEAGILSAKGNSGLLMAHWFLGISRSVGEKARVDHVGLAAAMDVAAREVYGAVDDPVEGTILTVMRAASQRALEVARDGADVESLLDEVVRASEAALERTPELLPVLREAGVVDAGAAGWVNFMRGVHRAIRGLPPPEWTEETLLATAAHPPIVEAGAFGERYCTELVCRGQRFDAKELRRVFAGSGSSLLVATTGTVFKLHVHSDHPDEVFRKAARLGQIVERKVDDMRRQTEAATHPDRDALQRALLAQPGTPAIIVDSTSDLPERLRREHGIEMVPLQVLFGGEVFRDQVDLSSAEFYRRLRRGEAPTTSQPPPRAFVEALGGIRNDRDVIVVVLAANLSGTYESARAAARIVQHSRVEVFDSRSASVGAGLLALGASRLAERGMPTDAILEWLGRWRDGTVITFTVQTLDYLRRGGRISAGQALFGNLLGMRPVLQWRGEAVRPVAKVRGDEEAFAKVLEESVAAAGDRARVRLGLIGDDADARLDAAERELARRLDVVESVRGSFTGVIGTHTGPGTWGVVVQRVPKGDPLAG
jgi:hypothetical protein